MICICDKHVSTLRFALCSHVAWERLLDITDLHPKFMRTSEMTTLRTGRMQGSDQSPIPDEYDASGTDCQAVSDVDSAVEIKSLREVAR
jgi:hypothetical protein